MKYRNGFVSNSSSCSFCIGKVYMTEEQIKKFEEFIDFISAVERDGDDGMYEFTGHEFSKYVTEHISFCEGGPPASVPYYFIGEIDQSIIGIIGHFLRDIGVDEKYICMHT